jgi:hypothetical protein
MDLLNGVEKSDNDITQLNISKCDHIGISQNFSNAYSSFKNHKSAINNI